MTTMSVVGECFFWYWLTRVVPDNFHRAVKRLCVCVFCLCQNTNFKFHLRLPLLCISIFVPTSKKLLCRTPNVDVQANYFFANNFILYINSQQKINMAIYIHWTSIAISHIGPNLPYLNVISDECTKFKQRHIKCSHRPAKIAQTTQNMSTPVNETVVAMTLTSRKRLLPGVIFCETTVTFLQISRKPHFDHDPDYIFGKPMNRHFQRYTVCI